MGRSSTAMDTSPSGDSAATLLAKLQARNRVEVDAFKAVFEAHAGAQRQARVLQERVAMLNRRCAELSEAKEKMEADLKVANEAAAKGTAVKDQSARISELQTELAASYKQHAESSQQVIAAKEQQAKAEQELVTAKDALAVAERERDEARERGSELEAALEESRTAAAATSEAEARLSARNEAVAKAEAMEAENASLVERLMQLKMAEAEKMNEINDLYDNLQRQKKSAEMRAMASDLSAASAESMSSLTGAVGGANAFGSGYFPARKRLAIRANVGGTHRVAFTPGGDVLATAGDDRTVALFDAGSGNPTGPERLTGSTGAMLDVDFSGGDGGGAGSVLMVLGAGTDRAVRLWDATTGRTRHTLTGHAEKVVSAKFCPWNYARAVSCSHDRTIKVWDLERGFCKASIMCASNCNSVTYGESAAVVISGHYDGAARIWDLRQKPGAACDPVEVRGHSQHVTAVTMMPTNRSQFITSSRDNTLKLVDLRSGQGDVVRTLKASGYRSGTQWANPCVAPDGRHVVAGGADGGVFVWNVNDGGLKVTLRGHDVAVATCAWSQSGLVTADKNGVAIVWSG